MGKVAFGAYTRGGAGREKRGPHGPSARREGEGERSLGSQGPPGRGENKNSGKLG